MTPETTRDQIRRALTEHPEGLSINQLQRAVTTSQASLRRVLHTMTGSGEVTVREDDRLVHPGGTPAKIHQLAAPDAPAPADDDEPLFTP